MRTRLHHVVGLVCLAFGLGALGCQAEPPGPTLLLELRSVEQLATLEVLSKQYHDEDPPTVFSPAETTIPAGSTGYRTSEAGTPLRLRLLVPEPGFYAFHFVGRAADGESDPGVASVCLELTGVRVERELVLGRLPRSLDIDGDSFPEDVSAFCALQSEEGRPCHTWCNDEAYNAMADCHPEPGFIPPDGCDEPGTSESFNPFAVDLCGDCYDQDCFRGDAPCIDRDGDGYPGGELDCDDDDPAINPAAEEICGNGIDENCLVEIEACETGDLPCDADNDGFREQDPERIGCGSDCDDSSPEINPDALEGCGVDPSDPTLCPGCPPSSAEGVDDNCDGRPDEGCFSDDLDDDGVVASEDCDDCNAGVGPGQREVCGDGLDQDCSGADQVCGANDEDGDGHEALPAGDDCDDSESRVYPGAPERCDDGVAQGCSADVPCDSVTEEDGDFFGVEDGDCDDSDATINPWAEERCDTAGVDEDCDTLVNEVSATDANDGGCIYLSSDEGWVRLDYSDDVNHCGGCRHRCCPGPCWCEGNDCLGGVCTCYGETGCGGDPSSHCCPGGCRDIRTDPQNCGGCGVQCLENEECLTIGGCGQGQCVCVGEPDEGSCPDEAGVSCCPGFGCTDVSNDPENCGSCGNDCTEPTDTAGARGDICVVDSRGDARCYCGVVGVVCSGTDWCTLATEPEGQRCGCADLNSDRSNCGRCGNVCGENELCIEGECQCEDEGRGCGAAEVCCLGIGCAELSSDTESCGACGAVCAWGEECVGGVCRCGAGAGCDPLRQDCCSGACRNVLTDVSSCGELGTGEGCGNACPGEAPCEGGRCICDDDDYTDCEGRCDCLTGDGFVCCDDTCHSGECCSDADCVDRYGNRHPTCRESDRRCVCATEGVDGGTCPGGHECCDDGCQNRC